MANVTSVSYGNLVTVAKIAHIVLTSSSVGVV